MSTQDWTVRHRDRSLREIHEGLADVIERWTVGKEDCSTPIGNLDFFRREGLTEPCACLVEPSLVFVVQGAKQMLVGGQSFAYDTGSFLLNSLDLPASSQVLEASPNRPCLGLVLRLDRRALTEIIAQSRLTPPKQESKHGSLAIGTMTPTILEPFDRFLALLDEPDAIPVLAPLIEREIHFRLLTCDAGQHLWSIASASSQNHRIASAIDWLRIHYSEPLRVDELAAHAQMSASTLHHHFRMLTAMSPLQYQKWLRLNEAKRLMLNELLDAASAAFHVGYESPSQFSREYSRQFGMPPKRDIDVLRRKAEV